MKLSISRHRGLRNKPPLSDKPPTDGADREGLGAESANRAFSDVGRGGLESRQVFHTHSLEILTLQRKARLRSGPVRLPTDLLV